MRIAVMLLALVLATGASARQTVPLAPEEAPPTAPAVGAARPDALCRDRIIQVRKERGLPELRRETATTDELLFIAAVDHRIDGCSVLVMRNDTSDIRPLPVIEGPGRLMPAK